MLPTDFESSQSPSSNSPNKLTSIREDLLKAGDAIYYLAAIVESSQDSIITINFEGLITSWNQAAQEVYGYSPDEAIGQPLTMLTLPTDLAEVLRNNERVRHNRRVEMFETVRVNKDGRHMDLEIVMSPIKDVAGEVIGISIIARDITDRKEAEAAQREREESRHHEEASKELVRRIVKTQEEERGRIARELHDNLGQHLTAVMFSLKNLETQIEAVTGGKRQQGITQLDTLRTLVDGLMTAAHRQAWELRPAELDALGLEAALGQYFRDWSRQFGLEVDFRPSGWEARPGPDIETTLYRVVQEALTNVARHAEATQVSVTIEMDEKRVCAIIEDNGGGFDTEQSTGRLGVLGMRERLALVGGTLEIESIPDEGTTVFACVPL